MTQRICRGLSLAALGLCACGSTPSGTPADAGPPEASDDAGAPRCDVSAPFQAAVPLAGIDTPDHDEYDVRLTPDERTAYFISNRARADPTQSDVFVATRDAVGEPFGTPALVPGMAYPNASAEDPNVTPDQLSLVFIGAPNTIFDRPPRLCEATRPSTSVPFGTPTFITTVNTGAAPYLVNDGLTVYFVTHQWGGEDIGVSRRPAVGQPFGTAPALVPVTGMGDAGPVLLNGPVLTPDERTMFFVRVDLVSGRVLGNIWQASRASTDAPFGDAGAVGSLATAAGEAANWISPDGCRLYFTRAIPTDPAGDFQQDIYVSERAR